MSLCVVSPVGPVQAEACSSSLRADVSDKLHEDYSAYLKSSLRERRDLVLDFTCLKACLDPTAEPTQEPENEEGKSDAEFDYESFLCKYFDDGTVFPELEQLVIRNSKFCVQSLFDRSSELIHGVLQPSSLTELDLSGNPIPGDLQSNLQFWNLYNLKTLKMDATQLQKLPPSVGRLQKLELLSLNDNKLKDLPITLSFCENLKVLNLKQNKFVHIPGVVMHLEKLEELRRLNNGQLAKRWEGFERAPHVTVKQEKTQTKTAYNPDMLQNLCTKLTLKIKLEYWKLNILGPLQCKTLDRLATQFLICEGCGSPIYSDEPFGTILVMLVKHLGLTDVPFEFHACSAACMDEVKKTYSEMNQELQKEIDSSYLRDIARAQMANNVNDAPDFESRTHSHTRHRRRYHTRRNRKCAIM